MCLVEAAEEYLSENEEGGERCSGNVSENTEGL
jgi:hypothetical protein